MGISVNNSGVGTMIWEGFNTLLGAAGTAMGATALGSKTSEDKVREIIREENNRNGGSNGSGRSFNDSVLVMGQPCSHNTPVTRFEMEQSQRISELESGRETDAKLLEVWKAAAASDQRQDEKFAQLTKSLTDYVISNNREVDAIRCEARLNNQEIRDNLRFLDYKIDTTKSELNKEIDCRTLPLEKKVGINQICPTPLAACSPVALQGQILTTTPTGETNTVVGSVRTVAGK